MKELIITKDTLQKIKFINELFAVIQQGTCAEKPTAKSVLKSIPEDADLNNHVKKCYGDFIVESLDDYFAVVQEEINQLSDIKIKIEHTLGQKHTMNVEQCVSIRLGEGNLYVVDTLNVFETVISVYNYLLKDELKKGLKTSIDNIIENIATLKKHTDTNSEIDIDEDILQAFTDFEEQLASFTVDFVKTIGK